MTKQNKKKYIYKEKKYKQHADHTSGWCTLEKKKKKQFASIADLNLTTSPHFLTTTLFLRSKGQSSSFSAPPNPFLLLFLPCFHEKFSCFFRVSARPESYSFKIPAVSFILVGCLCYYSSGPKVQAMKKPTVPRVLTPLWCVPLQPPKRHFSGKISIFRI